MTILVSITKKDLLQKLQICKSLAKLLSINAGEKVFDYNKFIPSLIYIQKEISSCGNYVEIWINLDQIERDLLELV